MAYPDEQNRASLSLRRGFQAARIRDPEERRRYISESANIDANPEGIRQKTDIQDNLQTRSDLLGSMKHGGDVHRTGPYLLHAGEHVVPKKKNRWMQQAANSIKSSGHKGVFSSAAHRAGKSTHAFAEEHKHSSGTVGKRARLALAFAKAKH